MDLLINGQGPSCHLPCQFVMGFAIDNNFNLKFTLKKYVHKMPENQLSVSENQMARYKGKHKRMEWLGITKERREWLNADDILG